MEHVADAWSADEPILDFSRLTAPQPREPGRTDARTDPGRSHASGVESVQVARSPLAGIGATASADAQSAAAALFAAPMVWTDAPAAPQTVAAAIPSTAMFAAESDASGANVEAHHTAAVTDVAFAAASSAAHVVVPPPAIVAAIAIPVAAPTSTEHAPPRIEPHAAASPAAMPTVTLPNAATPTSVTIAVAGQAYTSMTTTYGADGSVVSVDLYGFAQTFDHVRLDYRADGSVETRTLLDTEDPDAAIVIDYDAAGDAVARHEIDLPGRPYSRVDILYDADGSVVERTRSGFASGDLASITVRFDGHGAITQVEHLQLDGARTIIGTAAANTLAGHGGETLVGRGGADTFVLLDGGTQPLAIADFHAAQGDRLDLSHLLAGGTAHFLADAAFDGHAGAVRFEHVDAGVLVSVDVDGDTIGDASVLLAGAHAVAAPDIIL